MSYETELGIYIQAYDESSSVIQSLLSNLSEIDTATQQATTSTSNMGNAYKSASSQVNEINAQYGYVTKSADATTQSFSSQVLMVNSLALAGATLFMSFERVSNSEVYLDRANLNVQKSTNALQASQVAYNKAVVQYGVDSQQATDAAARLATAQDSLTVAQERVGVAQNNLNNSMIYAALAVVPSAIAVIGGLYTAYHKLPETMANVASKLASLDISMKTLAISTAAAVGAFAATYIILESVPEPMRQTAAVIAILIGVLIAATVAVAAFYGALSWGTALPVVLGSVAAAVAGVTVALQGASSAATTYGASITGITGTALTGLAAVTAAINEFVTAENARYQADLAIITAYWNVRLGLTKTFLETIDAEIITFYTAEETAAQTASQAEVDVANAAYDQQLTDFKSFWSLKLGFQTTELTTVDSEIERFYAQQTSDLQTTYDQQISDTNSYYDDLIAASMTGLNSIRAARQGELDTLEMNMLAQRVALEDAHTAGLISDKKYQAEVAKLNQTYSAQRSDTSDHYRLVELEAEQTQADEAVTIEAGRTADLTTIAGAEATDLAAIETRKNADLLAAAQQYATITTTGLQTLNNTLAQLAASLATIILGIENQKNADLQTAYAQEEAAAQTHQDILASINQAGVNTSIKVLSSGYDTSLKNFMSYTGALVTNFPEEYQTIGTTTGPGGTARIMQHGGIVTEPTYALIGEAGPEAVIPLNRLQSTPTTIYVTMSPHISVGSIRSNASLEELVTAITLAVKNGMAEPLVTAFNQAFAEKTRRSG
jgi:hypothetical protein